MRAVGRHRPKWFQPFAVLFVGGSCACVWAESRSYRHESWCLWPFQIISPTPNQQDESAFDLHRAMQMENPQWDRFHFINSTRAAFKHHKASIKGDTVVFFREVKHHMCGKMTSLTGERLHVQSWQSVHEDTASTPKNYLKGCICIYLFILSKEGLSSIKRSAKLQQSNARAEAQTYMSRF